MSRKHLLALCQLAVGTDKAVNLAKAQASIQQAAAAGARIVQLPECFNCPYGNKYFPTYAEPTPMALGKIDVDPKVYVTTAMLSSAAKENNVYLIGGSIPEKDGENVFNTSLCFGPDGSLLAKHRKVHLFDIDVPGGVRFKESETLTAGNAITTFETDICKVGVGICYDVRFPELAMAMAREGCKLLCYPGAFNMTTGPAHWELLARARALDNQVYVSLCSVARDESAEYIAWGHSSVVNPWGEVVETMDEKPGIIYAPLDFDRLDEIRQSVPVTKQRREDLYKLTWN
eukprot:Rmarinus@m.3990